MVGLIILVGSAGGVDPGHAIAAETSPKNLTATALAFVSAIAYLISGGIQILPGIFLDLTFRTISCR